MLRLLCVAAALGAAAFDTEPIEHETEACDAATCAADRAASLMQLRHRMVHTSSVSWFTDCVHNCALQKSKDSSAREAARKKLTVAEQQHLAKKESLALNTMYESLQTLPWIVKKLTVAEQKRRAEKHGVPAPLDEAPLEGGTEPGPELAAAPAEFATPPAAPATLPETATPPAEPATLPETATPPAAPQPLALAELQVWFGVVVAALSNLCQFQFRQAAKPAAGAAGLGHADRYFAFYCTLCGALLLVLAPLKALAVNVAMQSTAENGFEESTGTLLAVLTSGWFSPSRLQHATLLGASLLALGVAKGARKAGAAYQVA